MPLTTFRPVNDTRVDDATDPIDWEDNAVSNAMAAVSFYVTPKACQTPEHFSSRFANLFYTTCPCCMFYRGLTVAAVPLLALITILLII